MLTEPQIHPVLTQIGQADMLICLNLDISMILPSDVNLFELYPERGHGHAK